MRDDGEISISPTGQRSDGSPTKTVPHLDISDFCWIENGRFVARELTLRLFQIQVLGGVVNKFKF